MNMEYLKTRKSILNCPICSGGVRRQGYFPEQYFKEFSWGMQQFWQHKFMPVTPDSSHDKLTRNRAYREKYMSSCRDGYEQKYRKILKNSKKHAKKPTAIYQVYTLTTNNNKPQRKPSKTVYSYPFSSSSSEASTSFFERHKKRSITIHPSAKKGSDDEDTDSEYSTCKKFPITEKHYRHIVDGVECSSRYKKPSISKKTHKEDRNKITKKVNIDFNEMYLKQPNGNYSHACQSKAKKKCNCKSKCNTESEDDKSDSQLSEKTFIKFMNSLHTYITKVKKLDRKKYQRYRLDTNSSCSLCLHQDTSNKKKRASKEYNKARKHHHHHHHSHQKTETEGY